MKKVLFTGIIAAIAFSSCCKKDYCEEPEEVEVCDKGKYEKDWDDDDMKYDKWDKDEDYDDDKEEWDDEDKKEYEGKKMYWKKKKEWDDDDCDPKPMTKK